MKKMFFLAAIAALGFASCSSELEVADKSSTVEDGAVSFNVTTLRNTRTASDLITATKDLANAGGFGVFAYDQDATPWTTYSATNTYPQFFHNQKVWGCANGNESDGQTSFDANPHHWNYSPIKYFNNNEGAKHSFFVYAPYQKNVKSVFSYQGPAIRYNATENYDLMWAEPKIDLPKIAVDQTLDFNFKHALSKVSFEVTAFVDKVHPEHTGTFALDENTTIVLRSVKFIGNVPTQGLLSLKTGEWTIENADNNAYEFVSNAMELKKSDVYVADAINYKTVSTNDMVIPTAAGQNVRVRVIYDVITKDDTHPQNSSTITNTIESQEDFALVKGMAYDFKLDLGLTSVKFEATAKAWDADKEVNVDLPNNNGFHYCSAVALAAVPTYLTANVENDTKPTTCAQDDYWYDAANHKMLKASAANTWGITASPGKYRSTTAIYTVTTDGVVTNVEKTGYYSVTSGSPATTSWYAIDIAPTPTALTVNALKSLNVNSKGQIELVDGGWTDPTADDYYSFEGKLYQWKSNSH